MRSNALLYISFTLFFEQPEFFTPDDVCRTEDKNHINEELTKFLLKWN